VTKDRRLENTLPIHYYKGINVSHVKKVVAAFGLIGILNLVGCAVSGPVQSVQSSKSGFDGAAYPGVTRIIVDDPTELEKYPISEQYSIFEQSATGYGSIPEARDQAEPRAKDFCRSKNKVMKTLKEITSTPPHILGNWPRIEIVFVCIDKPVKG
jgi:hypothetical protein